VERHGNNHVETPAAQAGIIQGFAEPLGQRMAQMPLLSVLEIVHQFAHDAAAAISRDSSIEMQGALFAIGAAERLGNGAEERLGTFCAERRHNSRGAALAARTKIFVPFDGFRTGNAGWRIKKRTEGGEGINSRDEAHGGTRF
jgi:hypothetical protein